MGSIEREGAEARRATLRRELRDAEDACQRLRAGLLALGPGARLPGLHLVAAVGGAQVVIPGARIAEIAPVVACDPVPGAPAWVSGSFLWRGRPAVAIDLAARLGAPASTAPDAILVVLDGEPTVALLVPEVCGLAEDPDLADAAADSAMGPFLGVCALDGRTLPLLAPEALEREVGRLA